MKMRIFVMPARIAGIQARKDASVNVHVDLDSSAPCWNDAIEGALLKLIEARARGIFNGDREEQEGKTFKSINFRDLRGPRMLRGEYIFQRG
jgi:hypothetical protein